MEKLLPGDLVMADRSFIIHESLVCKQAELAIPAITQGKDQLDPVDAEKTRGIQTRAFTLNELLALFEENTLS